MVILTILLLLGMGVHFCMHHPVANHVSHDGVSPSFHALFSSLSTIYSLCSMSEVLSQLKWREAMEEEMQALENY